MGNIDLNFYWSVFMRRLPYFLVIAVLLASLGIAVAMVLPSSYVSEGRMLVERPQIPGELAESTVPIDPYEQIQIIQQRIMTRTNLLELADRVGLYEDTPEMTASQMASDIAGRIEFIGFEPDETQQRGLPGATIIAAAFWGPTPQIAASGANALVSLILEENVRMRTSRAGDTLDFFDTEVKRLEEALEEQSRRISEFKTANVEALPDSMATRRAQQERENQRLLELEREEAGLRNQRDTVIWLFERTGRASSLGPLSPEEQELDALRSELIQKRAVYSATSPQIRMLENRLAALEGLVEEQQEQRVAPGLDGSIGSAMSELDVELAPIDARLDFIAEEKAAIERQLDKLNSSIVATPANEMVLGGLELEMESLERQHTQAVANRSQAAVGERIEVLAKGERFTLIEPPTEPNGPAKPRRKLIAAAGVIGGIGAGLGFVLLMELLNRSIRRPVDLSDGLGIQPFATVPYMRTVGERRWRLNLILLVLVAIVIAIPAGLFLVHTYYLPIDLLIDQGMEKVGLAGEAS
jgi:uncharacterized protein involved in exopolysaccharide biosynthesis